MPQQPLTRIRARNFRSLRDVDVPLGPLTVLIGPNGSGKTNVLNVLRFLARTTRTDLEDALLWAGGYERVQRRARDTGPVELLVEARVTAHSSGSAPDVYELVLRRHGGVVTREESFQFKRTEGRGRRIAVQGTTVAIQDEDTVGPESRSLANAQTSGLATLPRLADDEGGEGIRAFADFLSDLYVLEPDVSAARSSARLGRRRLAADAGNLSAALHSLSQDDGDAFAALEDDLSRCLPGLDGVRFEAPASSAARELVAVLHEHGVTEPVPLADASFGTVRLLALLVALHDPEPPPLTAVEEIDHGLHPYAIDVLVDRMRAATERTQLLVTTHSPTLVNRLTPEEVVVCDRDPRSGESVIPAVDADEIASAIDSSGWRPGELWFSGAIHGVPA